MSLLTRLLAWTLALALVAMPIVAVFKGWFAAEHWPLERLQLTAEFVRVDAAQVQAAVAPHLSAGFFAVDLEAVRTAVAALPWVAEVEVRRRWPDALELRVLEHRAFARWGSDRLVSDRGRIFHAFDGEPLPELPELSGPDARLAEVLDLHAEASALLARSRLGLRAVRLSPRGSWSLRLGDGARVLLGRQDPLPRLRRLERHLPALLRAEQRALALADLRYGNGFALRWHNPEPPPAAAAPASRNPA